jgi:hypothetical protein
VGASSGGFTLTTPEEPFPAPLPLLARRRQVDRTFGHQRSRSPGWHQGIWIMKVLTIALRLMIVIS